MTVRVLEAHICATAAGPEGYPAEELPEIAFLGRSNVGKSSLLNRMVGRRSLARTSSTPGKTRLIHFYHVRRSEDRSRVLVDLPGYGFARVSRTERARWKQMVEGYLGGRACLGAVVLLQDLRRDASEEETALLDWLDERGVPCLVALTKCDKLGSSRRAQRVRTITAQLEIAPERVVATSASKGFGIDELWRSLDKLTKTWP